MNRFAPSKIVAAVTLRDRSVHPAMLRSVSLARASRCEVALVHAAEKHEILPDGTDFSSAACRRYEAIKSSHPEITSTCLKTGSIWNALLESARGMEAQLVVIGSHVHSQLSALVGRSSDRVLRHADRDVLITRTERYATDQVPKNYQHILIATDLREHHRLVAERAVQVAANQGAKISLVHAVEHYPVDRENDEIAPEDQDPLVHAKHSKEMRLTQLAKETGILASPREVLITTTAACDTISDHAKKVQADLIFIGSRKVTPLNFLLGSNADRIVHHAPCDVWVVYLD